MFAADLSWTDDKTETVGDRKQRKAREGRASISTGSDTSSQQKVKEKSKPPQWKLNLGFGKSKKVAYSHSELSRENVTNYLDTLPPSRSYTPLDTRSITTSHRDDISVKAQDVQATIQSYDHMKDQILALQQRGYQHPKTISSPILDFSNLRLAQQQAPTPSSDYQPELSPTSTAFDRDVLCSRTPSAREPPEGSVMVKKSVTITVENSPPIVTAELDGRQVERPRQLERPRLIERPSSPSTRSSSTSDNSSQRSPPPGKRSLWAAPMDWGVKREASQRRSPPTSTSISPAKEIPQHVAVPPIPEEKQAPVPNAIVRHFQRMIRRMETAKPSVILDRLEEEWGASEDPVVMEELQIEKLLWAISALENSTLVTLLENTEKRSSQILRHTKRATNLLFDANISDVYRTAYLAPDFQMTYVSSAKLPTHAKSHISNIVTDHIELTPSSMGSISFPLPLLSSSVTQIFTSGLPTILPSSTIPAFFAECLRLLELGGSLELRLINALPERATLGPKLSGWLEDHLMIQLESDCRCSRPCEIFPNWANAAGFRMSDGGRAALSHVHRLSATAEEDLLVEPQVGAVVLREVWKDVWGSSVQFMDDKKKWWWEDEAILKECREMKTTWRVAKFVVFKPL